MSMQGFIDAYIECALWSSLDDDGEPLDSVYTVDDIHPAALLQMKDDCIAFYCDNKDDCWAHGTDEQCGHDFWLTRNGHGAGFWDRGTGAVGERLTDAAKTYGSCDLYVGDDGLIYL